MSGLLGSVLLKHIHLFEYLRLLVNALYVLQTHSDPSSDIQEVKISGDFIIGLSALHSSPNITQFGLKLLLLTVPLNFSLSLCCHSNQVGWAGERLKQKAHVNDSLLTHPPDHTQVNSSCKHSTESITFWLCDLTLWSFGTFSHRTHFSVTDLCDINKPRLTAFISSAVNKRTCCYMNAVCIQCAVLVHTETKAQVIQDVPVI